MCIGLSWNLQAFHKQEKTRQYGLLVKSTIMHIRATPTFSLWSSPLDHQRKRKEIKLFTRESSQQAKQEREIFLGFLLILQLNEHERRAEAARRQAAAEEAMTIASQYDPSYNYGYQSGYPWP